MWIDGLIGGLIEAPTCQHANKFLKPSTGTEFCLNSHPNTSKPKCAEATCWIQKWQEMTYLASASLNDLNGFDWMPSSKLLTALILLCWNPEACNLLWALRRQRHRRRWTSQNSRAAEERPKMTKRSNKALVNIYILYIYYIYIYVVKPSHLGKWLHNGGTAERFSWEKLHQAQPTLYLW